MALFHPINSIAVWFIFILRYTYYTSTDDIKIDAINLIYSYAHLLIETFYIRHQDSFITWKM